MTNSIFAVIKIIKISLIDVFSTLIDVFSTLFDSNFCFRFNLSFQINYGFY